MKFTELSLRKLKLSDRGQKTYFDDSLPGFGIRVSTKSKSFIVKYGENRTIKTIGRFPDLTLADARKEAKRFLAFIPGTKTSKSYLDAVIQYLEECEQRNRPSTIYGYKHYLNSFKTKKRLSDIKRSDIQKHLSIYKERPSAYSHALTALKIFFNWALRYELVELNPVAGERTIPIPSRERVLTYEELGEIYNYHHPPFSTILKLCILTGQRRSEIAAIDVDWIHDDAIVFPASITKNKRLHTIPLTSRSKVLIAGNGQVFGNSKGTVFSGWGRAKRRIDKFVDIPPWTIHDLRRTFATINAEIGTPIHITEKILNHTSGTISGVVAIYNRHSYITEIKISLNKYETQLSKWNVF